ncbi:uncharacterized protein LOC114877628 isoform X3 [Osmia bicornis bicornis]|uniref:uncharacterized protein LOC114877628 isoform X3 n=1 Tax=Osmia bicornis bicornis TaxID=1437191 RepID=UPI001EAF884B|nr:uncharacterized protein LOC114877628 isoform X3 [Osmia bicornis bicornis]
MFNRGLAALPVTEDHVLIQQLCHRVKVVAHKLHSCSSTKVCTTMVFRYVTFTDALNAHIYVCVREEWQSLCYILTLPTQVIRGHMTRTPTANAKIIHHGCCGTVVHAANQPSRWNPGDSFCVPTYYLGVPRTPPTLSAHQRNIFLGCQGPRRLNLRNDIILSWGVNDPSDYFCAPT